MVETLLQRVASEPLLGVLVLTTLVLLTLAAVTLVWLVARSLWDTRGQRRQQRFWDELGSGLCAALDDPRATDDWLRAARAHPPSVVRHCLNEHLVRTAGDYRDALARLYRALGLLDHDLAALRSRRWTVRMRALRRLATIVGPAERPAILPLAKEGGEMRLLVAQIIGRIGTALDVLGLLQSWQVTSRLSEYPLHVMIDGMSADSLRALISHWDALGHSVAVQRILLAAAARTLPSVGFELLPRAAAHASIELRIAAARGCGAIAREETFAIVARLAGDEAWEVRAQAVKALGAHRGPDSAALLSAMLSDKSFWVRQNAAAALGQHGAAGIEQLELVRLRSDDRFARDAADHVLTDLRHLPEAR